MLVSDRQHQVFRELSAKRQKLGLPSGRWMAVTGDEADLGAFRVPPLREVANTAPYLHDGSGKGDTQLSSHSAEPAMYAR